MPDQKVSAQPEHTTPVLGTDLLPLVANNDTTPTNYRVQVKNFLSQVAINLPQTTYSAVKVTANVTANAASAIQSAAEFSMQANDSMSALALDRYGLLVKNIIQNGNSDVSGQMAAGMFTLDTGNSTTDTSNTFGVIVRHYSNTAPRYIAPQAYIGIYEDANSGLETTYLMDIGAGGKSVSGDEANVNPDVIFSELGSAVATHVLKLHVNGVDLWVLASNVAPA